MNFGLPLGSMADQMKAYLQRVQDQQRDKQVLQQARINGDFALAVQARTGTVTAPSYEANGAKPVDTVTTTVPDVAKAVKAAQRAVQGGKLMDAISALHAQRASNGKPVVYVPE